jgi:hypothetical protein
MISIKNYKTATALLATAAAAAVLVGYTVTTGNDHFVLADSMVKPIQEVYKCT